MTCSYNLRALTADDRCPECGNPVAPSIEWARRVQSDPKWIATIRLSLILLLFAGGLAMASTPTLGSMQSTPPWQMVLMFVAQGLALASAWLISTAEPRRDDSPVWRIGLRVIALIVTVPPLLALVTYCMPPAVVGPISKVCNWVLWTSGVATLLCFMRLAQIARRFRWRVVANVALLIGCGLLAAATLGLIIFEFRRRMSTTAALMPVVGGGMPSTILPIILLLGDRDVTDAWQFYAWLLQPIFLLASWGLALVMFKKLKRLAALGR